MAGVGFSRLNVQTAARSSTDEWIHHVVYPCDGMLFGNKERGLLKHVASSSEVF